MIGEITYVLYKYGLSLSVVPELKSMTIGGLICAAGCELSSWKYGIFFETVHSYYIIFGNDKLNTIT